ncbi:sulfite exporter TauE/SafE family protein [Mycolicibacterium pyrenivorans]|uniref:sulfite exporter TauE/SafE family protein n=1 Tax=Mycolicibacterium pyrenivorans TaxID=187102 RepID=UPI0021F281BB|nr:sulfite exporter TauE/SafE family protein [Mycolicibacterium pyrenivorans]MCV7155441.1 sulfite exporter TauE/SafE family protein [Mycolicibacterium pyrenivorans]
MGSDTICRVTWPEALLLFAAGILGGLTGSIAGLASVATYPALLLAGLPPVTANVTNTVALVFNGVGSIWGSRPELSGQAEFLRKILPFAAVGGIAGAVLLLSTPAEGFEKVVPLLLGFAALTILVPVRPTHVAHVASYRRHTTRLILEGAAIFAICVYGGYFGAAAGVLLLALLLRAGGATLPRANAAKNVTLGVANGVAAVIFAVLAPVQWDAVAALGVGCLLGSRLGPIVVRHAPTGPMRAAIGLAGLVLAAKLGWDAYR